MFQNIYDDSNRPDEEIAPGAARSLVMSAGEACHVKKHVMSKVMSCQLNRSALKLFTARALDMISGPRSGAAPGLLPPPTH